MTGYSEARDTILAELSASLGAVREEEVERFAELLFLARSVFFVGVGRVLLSLEAMAKRLHHIGVDTHVVGDIAEPAITSDDLLVVGSGSGESVVPVAIAKVAKRYGAKVVHLGSNPQSSLAPLTDLLVRIPVKTKLNLPDELASEQIMSSLFEQSLLLLGDAIALMEARRRGLDLKELWRRHANLE